MDLQKKCLILGLILFAFCELSATTGLCRFARMFPNQGKPRDSKDDTSKEDKGCSDLLDGRIYRFVLDEMPVSNATKNCQRLSSSLVFIESKEEDDFVRQLVLRCAPDKGPWNGWTWIQNKESDNGLCRFARMFPNQGKPRDSKDDTSKEDKVVTCDKKDLPKVLYGSFDCPGSTDVLIDDVCNLTCDEGFYPVSTNQTVCEPDVTGDPNGKLSEGNFSCQAVTCDMNDLSEVLDGSFDCPGSTDLFIGDVCNLTCFYGFHPTSTYHTVCEPGVKGNRNGKWSKGNFTCQDCSDLLDERIYRFVLDEMSVSNATKNCESLNSSLVFIESEEEDQFVHQLVLRCAPDKGPWKGWTWTRNKESDRGYVNWDVNEPNDNYVNLCAKADCVGIKYGSGKWHDQCCNRPFYSVCEQSE